MSEHSPTPWKGFETVGGKLRINDANGIRVVGSMPRRVGKGYSDQAFVVRAVNSHEHLLTLCEVMVDMLEKDDSRYVHPAFRKQWLERARAVLTLAKEEVT